MVVCVLVFFVFKQRTAYEMRISDWSSDVCSSDLQVHARASWFKGLGERNRLIVRGEIGHTFTDALTAMPPSLRFYAGGDRSIRGHEWREVGPRIEIGRASCREQVGRYV